MNIIDKIKKSWWVIFSIIFFINGFGFIYIGYKHNNKNWILEGITYELPWLFYFIIFAIHGMPSTPAEISIAFALIIMLVGIIRSIWVAVKLADVYDNNEKYTIKSTVLAEPVNNKENDKSQSSMKCYFCIAVIFIIFAIIAIL